MEFQYVLGFVLLLATDEYFGKNKKIGVAR